MALLPSARLFPAGLTFWLAVLPALAFQARTSPLPKHPVSSPSQERYEQADTHFGGIQEAYDSAQQEAADAAKALHPGLERLTPAQRAAYTRLNAAFLSFVKGQVTGNVLFSAPYSPVGVSRESNGLFPYEERAAFDKQVAAFLKTPPPAPAPQQVLDSDAALNQVYRDLLANAALAATIPHSGVDAEMLRSEQRAWLAFRDAFVAFGKTLHPGLPPSAWLVPLTSARASDLKQVNDLSGQQWRADARKQQAWRSEVLQRQAAETASNRARVAQYFDHQTSAQAAAWQRVQEAVAALTIAHNSAVPNPSPIYADQQYDKLYGELYAFQYNDAHGFRTDPVKAQQGLAANEQRLSEAYQADLASSCLFKPVLGDPPTVHRTPEGLRAEERAWLQLREAWIDFLSTLFPDKDRASLANMFTGSRAFQLKMLTESCKLSGQAPKEQ